MENNFFSLFGEICDNGELGEIFSHCSVINLKIQKEKRLMEFDVSADCLVKGSAVEEAQKLIKNKLNLENAVINMHMPSECFSEEYFGTIVSEAKRSIAASNGFFKDSTASFDGKTLKINLTRGGLEVLKTCGCDTFIEKLVLTRFKRQIDVVFEGEEVTAEDERVISMIKQAEADIPKSAAKDIHKKEDLTASESNSSKPKKHDVVEGVPIYFETAKPIYGNKVSKTLTPICKISPEDGSCTVWGDVFALETRETKDGRSVIITFNITDGTYSYSCKIFEKKINCEAVLDKLKNGVTVIIKGDITFDKWSGENMILPKGLATVEKIPQTDDAEEKRVELHLHTKMSMMDGMTDPAVLVKRAIAWGHKAIAITDHGVVQAYPEAVAAAGGKIKIIYGMEAYFIDDTKRCFYFGQMEGI